MFEEIMWVCCITDKDSAIFCKYFPEGIITITVQKLCIKTCKQSKCETPSMYVRLHILTSSCKAALNSSEKI